MMVCMNYKMLEYDKIDISEDIDIHKAGSSKECNICQYWYFLNKHFIYEPYLCNGCHDLMQNAPNFKILNFKENDYRTHFWYMSKNYTINLMNNFSLNEKMDHYNFFSLYIKDE